MKDREMVFMKKNEAVAKEPHSEIHLYLASPGTQFPGGCSGKTF